MLSAGQVLMEMVLDESPGWNVMLPLCLIRSGLRFQPAGVLHESLRNALL